MAAQQQIEHDDSEAVTAFLRGLDHPMKAVMETIRTTILRADRSITEGIKWNTASFYSSGWFATINVRASVTFTSANDLRNKREAFKILIKAWVKCQPARQVGD